MRKQNNFIEKLRKNYEIYKYIFNSIIKMDDSEYFNSKIHYYCK